MARMGITNRKTLQSPLHAWLYLRCLRPAAMTRIRYSMLNRKRGAGVVKSRTLDKLKTKLYFFYGRIATFFEKSLTENRIRVYWGSNITQGGYV